MFELRWLSYQVVFGRCSLAIQKGWGWRWGTTMPPSSGLLRQLRRRMWTMPVASNVLSNWKLESQWKIHKISPPSDHSRNATEEFHTPSEVWLQDGLGHGREANYHGWCKCLGVWGACRWCCCVCIQCIHIIVYIHGPQWYIIYNAPWLWWVVLVLVLPVLRILQKGSLQQPHPQLSSPARLRSLLL